MLCMSVTSQLAITRAKTPVGTRVVTDDLRNRVTVHSGPLRIVSLSPGVTETLFAAGAGDRIVATVEYSDEPPAARHITRIGDATAIDIERLLALQPDVAVIWPGGGNTAQLRKLSGFGIPLYGQQVTRLSDLADSVRRLGALAETDAIAERAARDIEARLARLTGAPRPAQPLRILLQLWNRPIYTVGHTQIMSDALRVCGGSNIFAELADPSPAVDVEAVMARDPDMIIAAAPAREAAAWLADWRRFPALKAVRTGRLLVFEHTRLRRLGPSVIDATLALCERINAARMEP
jgi:iron complex transport system substrate-binding protein